MVKKTILICFLGTLFASIKANGCTCNSQYNEWSTTEKVIAGGAVTTGVIIAAPFVLPASAIAAIAAGVAATKAAVVGAVTYTAPYIIPSTTVGKVGLGLTATQYVRPCILQTTEEKLKGLLKEKEQKQYAPREEFITCLKQNKFGSPRNAAGRPAACEDLALAYALAAGNANLKRRTQAFKEGKCFCS